MIHSLHYKNHLFENEKILFTTEQHAIARLKSHVSFCIGIIIFIIMAATVLIPDPPPDITTIVAFVILAISLMVLYFMVWRMILLRRGLIFTDQRIILFLNTLFTRDVHSIEYDKIIEFEVKQSFTGSLLNYGDMIISLQEVGHIYFYRYKNITKVEKFLLNQKVQKSISSSQ